MSTFQKQPDSKFEHALDQLAVARLGARNFFARFLLYPDRIDDELSLGNMLPVAVTYIFGIFVIPYVICVSLNLSYDGHYGHISALLWSILAIRWALSTSFRPPNISERANHLGEVYYRVHFIKSIAAQLQWMVLVVCVCMTWMVLFANISISTDTPVQIVVGWVMYVAAGFMAIFAAVCVSLKMVRLLLRTL